MKKARVIYRESTDQFEIQINTGDGWGLDTAYNCTASARNPMGNADFIHFGILKKLAELQYLGYEISFKKLW